MTRNIKKLRSHFFSFIILLLFSCEKISSQENINKNQKKRIEQKQQSQNWIFVKSFSLSPNSNYTCNNDKYKNLLFGLKRDSVFLDNKYTDDVYTKELSPISFFKKQYLFNTYKKRLKDELDLNFPDKIITIRNKKAYDNSSQLDKYFQNAFFISQYMIVENNGCVVCFQKDNLNSADNNTNNLDKIYSKNVEGKLSNKLVNLPFDYEEMNKLSVEDNVKFLQKYPSHLSNDLILIKKLISNTNNDFPDEIFQINNGALKFKTYVYSTIGDSDSQTIINVSDDKLLSFETIGYAMPEGNESYQSFIINSDLSLYVYDINYDNRSKKIYEKFKIKSNGSIIKI